MRLTLLFVLFLLTSPIIRATQNESRSQHLIVSVKNKDGNYVWGLHAKDFIVEENGSSQTITELTASEAAVSVGILVDTSASMYMALPGVKDTAEALVRAAKPQDEVMLMTFSSSFRVTQGFTTDRQKIIKKLHGLDTNGHCSSLVMDSIIAAAKEMKGSKNRRRALVVFTDGQDNTGGSVSQVRGALLDQEIALYFATTYYARTGGELPSRTPNVSVTTGVTYEMIVDGCSISLTNRPPVSVVQGTELRGLAEESGGHFVNLMIRSDNAWTKIAEVFLESLLTDVRGQYTLAYSTTNSANGLGPAIRVRTSSPDYQVRMRREVTNATKP